MSGSYKLKAKRFLFAHYLWSPLLIVPLAAILWICLPQAAALLAFGAGVAAILGFAHAMQQQVLAETQLFKQLFTEFNIRYDAMNEKLEAIANRKALESGDRQVIVDYLNLCAEEYLFYSEGYIHPEVWRSWCAGMLWYLKRKPFDTVWAEERATRSYYGLSIEALERGAS